MVTFDEYINSLEGKSELDPQKIVSDLLGIHTTEIGTREAKISQLDQAIAEKHAEAERLEREVRDQKALNFDLAARVPSVGDTRIPSDDPSKPHGGKITIGDLFKPEVRTRHGR